MPNIAINNEPLSLKFDIASESRPPCVPASVFIKAKYKELYKTQEKEGEMKRRASIG